MFTGIIETLAEMQKISNGELCLKLANDDIKIGDSIAVNGICLTVKKIKDAGKFKDLFFDISPETLSRTNLQFIKPGEKLNIEKALTIGSRLDGHLVTGHVDGLSKILSIKRIKESFEFEFSIPKNLGKYIAEKGSVALDGISLTVAKKLGEKFIVAVVPFTFKQTNLQYREKGDFVNLEIDIIARYVESILSSSKRY